MLSVKHQIRRESLKAIHPAYAGRILGAYTQIHAVDIGGAPLPLVSSRRLVADKKKNNIRPGQFSPYYLAPVYRIKTGRAPGVPQVDDDRPAGIHLIDIAPDIKRYGRQILPGGLFGRLHQPGMLGYYDLVEVIVGKRRLDIGNLHGRERLAPDIDLLDIRHRRKQVKQQTGRPRYGRQHLFPRSGLPFGYRCISYHPEAAFGKTQQGIEKRFEPRKRQPSEKHRRVVDTVKECIRLHRRLVDSERVDSLGGLYIGDYVDRCKAAFQTVDKPVWSIFGNPLSLGSVIQQLGIYHRILVMAHFFP